MSSKDGKIAQKPRLDGPTARESHNRLAHQIVDQILKEPIAAGAKLSGGHALLGVGVALQLSAALAVISQRLNERVCAWRTVTDMALLTGRSTISWSDWPPNHTSSVSQTV